MHACALVALMGAAVLPGCKTGLTDSEERPEALPGYTELARAHNESVGRFETLWASVVTSIEYVDAKGDEKREQGEGHIQLIKPDRVALSIGKLGEVIVWLGAHGQQFWLIEPTADPPGALVGSHDEWTARARDRLGIPVRPESLIDALGLTALPASVEAPGAYDTSANGVTFDTEERRFTFDLATGRLARVEFIDSEGEVLARATLTGETPVELPNESGFFPRIAKRVEIVDPSTGNRFRLTFSRAEARSIGDRVFDPSYLLEAFRVENVRELGR